MMEVSDNSFTVRMRVRHNSFCFWSGAIITLTMFGSFDLYATLSNSDG